MAWACPVCNQINDDDSFIKCPCGYEIEAADTKQYAVDLSDSKTKLPASIIKEAFRIPWEKRNDLFRVLICPIVLLTCISFAIGTFYKSIGLPFVIVLRLIDGIIFTIYAVTIHRIILLGNSSVTHFGIYTWTMRETRFLGWYIAIHIWLFIITLPNTLMEYYGITEDFVLIIIKLTLFVAGFYVFSRLSILLPATAVDKRYDTAWAWDITNDNGANLIIVLSIPGALYAPFYILTGYNVYLDFICYFFQYVVMAIGIVALSLSYNFLIKIRTHNESLQKAQEVRS